MSPTSNSGFLNTIPAYAGSIFISLSELVLISTSCRSLLCWGWVMSSLSTALLRPPLIFPKQVYGLLFCAPWGCPSKNARSLVIQSPLAHGVPPISSVNKAKSALTRMRSRKQEGKLTQGPPGVSLMHKNHQISYSHLLRLLTVVYFKYYENDNELVSATTNFKSSYKHLLPSFVYL